MNLHNLEDHHKKPQDKVSNITKLIPNGITILALCSGLTSIRYSIL